ncbi:hypothetical protein KS4_35700 [Poriferisphaera corsica]|uniref:Uncharacterized protein n=1 Tax=Poriferisphaera corsica TaxID=2528020 RepID=A0A517YZ46_9BACT|nr:hypothetical protein [Poriferisphaera corsica]QDU35487.1 hypothetical protein KS4_35700 [Poriferisphaera corsica]
MTFSNREHDDSGDTFDTTTPITPRNNIWLDHALHPENKQIQTQTYAQEQEKLAQEIHHLEDILLEVRRVSQHSSKPINNKLVV